MALSAEESSTMLPVRPVYIRNRRSSQTMRTGVGMPTYTIQKDAPWMHDARDSVVSSTNSDDDLRSDSDSRQHTSSSVNGLGPSYQVSCHATAHDHVTDHGPQARTARMPIFKQVRNILQKPSSESLAFNDPSDDMSETGKPGQMKPNTYVSPWDAAFKTRRKSPERKEMPKLSKRASLSGLKALSQLHIQKSEEDVKPTPPLKAGRCSPRVVSPVSSSHSNQAPSAISSNLRTQPRNILGTLNIGKQLKRKPAPGTRAVSQSENMPPSPQLEQGQSAKSEWTDTFSEDVHNSYSNHYNAAADASAGNSPQLLQAEDPQTCFSTSTANWISLHKPNTRNLPNRARATRPQHPLPPSTHPTPGPRRLSPAQLSAAQSRGHNNNNQKRLDPTSLEPHPQQNPHPSPRPPRPLEPQHPQQQHSPLPPNPYIPSAEPHHPFPPPGGSNPPTQSAYAAPPGTHAPTMQPPLPTATAATAPHNPLFTEILGPHFATAPTALAILNAEPQIGREKLENLKRILEESEVCRTDIEALGRKLMGG
ncbi:hypothetical protein KC352_g695 [Hortaea werneckii]|nr:hypothetical protein KC352_g695 [Hortaea werneckii]